MTSLSTEKEQLIKRGSNRAALITLIGALVLAGAFAYSAIQLVSLNGQVDEKRQQNAALEENKVKLMQQRDELETANIALTGMKTKLNEEIAILERKREDLDKYATVLYRQNELTKQVAERTVAVVNRSGAAGEVVNRNVDELLSNAPIEAVARPSATATQVPGNSKLYDFKLNLTLPSTRVEEVEKVSYFFDHPSFTKQVQTSTNAASDFAVGYRGWGALPRVIITIHLRTGRTAEIAFDMAEAVNSSRQAGSRPVRTKGGDRPVPTKGGDRPVPTRGLQTPDGVPSKAIQRNFGNDVPTKGNFDVEVPVKGDGDKKVPAKGGVS